MPLSQTVQLAIHSVVLGTRRSSVVALYSFEINSLSFLCIMYYACMQLFIIYLIILSNS